MRDGPLLRAVKRIALWQYEADLALHRGWRRARGERPWTLQGSCCRSGACCEAPAIQVGWPTWALPTLRRVFLGWQRRVNGFELTATDRRARLLVFRCSHYDRATRSCDSYASRPGVCRDYPRNLMWQPSPQMLPPCAYRATPPNAKELRVAIDGLDLTPLQKEKLRRGLRLDG
jgi:Fe-S-cluster containining protein